MPHVPQKKVSSSPEEQARREAARKPGPEDVHEQRQDDQPQEGVVTKEAPKKDEPGRPLLNHLGVLVDAAAPAQDLGVEVADVVDAPNTFAVFVWGPDRVKLEYVEHKASFSLR